MRHHVVQHPRCCLGCCRVAAAEQVPTGPQEGPLGRQPPGPGGGEARGRIRDGVEQREQGHEQVVREFVCHVCARWKKGEWLVDFGWAMQGRQQV